MPATPGIWIDGAPAPATTGSCTTCMACVEACPGDTSGVRAIIARPSESGRL